MSPKSKARKQPGSGYWGTGVELKAKRNRSDKAKVHRAKKEKEEKAKKEKGKKKGNK